MPRNSSGTMSPANGPYVSGTTISTVAVNARFGDIETEITDSASRSGKGGFTAPVRTADGTVAAPAHAFTAEPGTGFWRSAAGEVAIAILGVLGFKFTAAGMQVSGANPILRSVDAHAAISLQGNQAAADPGTDTALSSVAVRTAGDLTQIQNAGNAQLAVNYQGLVRLINQAGALQPASIWTAITPGTGYTAAFGLAYWKDASGIVHIKGAVVAGASAGTTLFTLPAGFRPALGTSRGFLIYDGAAGFLRAVVGDTGNVTTNAAVTNTATSWLDVISFLAEQ